MLVWEEIQIFKTNNNINGNPHVKKNHTTATLGEKPPIHYKDTENQFVHNLSQLAPSVDCGEGSIPGRTKAYTTVAQKWHIVSLLGDVTSPTTVAQYVSMTCSEHREALTAAQTADGVHKEAFRVEGWSTLFATDQEGRFRYVTAVDGGLERFPSVAWFAHPWPTQTCNNIAGGKKFSRVKFHPE